MKTITKYVADNGVEFYTEAEALREDALITNVESIMSVLPDTPKNDGCRFANGGTFIQHDLEVIQKVKVELLKLAKTVIDHKWIDQTIKDKSVDPSWVARLLSDYNCRPLNNAWYRFQCMDVQGREWGQPYFAKNTNDAAAPYSEFP